MKKTGYLKDITELRKLIIENPDLPLVVMASSDACAFDWDWTYCSKVTACIGEILDCETEFTDEHMYEDRDLFADDVYDFYYNKWDGNFDGTDDEFDEYIEKQIKKYDPYWQKCVIIYADN